MLPQLFPKPIRPGDTLAFIAPASAPKPDQLAAGIESLENAGYRVKTYRDLCKPAGYLAGSDNDRAAELMQAFQDAEVTGIIAVRGGYGVSRILNQLDYDTIAQHPKVLAGYSDLSALHTAIHQRTGLITFHSPNGVDRLAEGDDGGNLLSQRSFWQAVGPSGNAAYAAPIAEHECELQTVAGGTTEERLIGGNLAVIAGLVGTPYQPETKDAILFLEDIGEAPYRVDRLLSQLHLAGLLNQVAGILLGHFTDCVNNSGTNPAAETTTLDVLRHYLADLGVPVLAGIPVGHDQPNLTLPIGATVMLDADRQQLVIERCTK